VTSRLVVESLAEHHDLQGFDCGHDELNEWLRRHARHAVRQGTRTYVLIQEGSLDVLGYFALAPHLLERAEVPPRIGRGAPHRIPAILLAKLALDIRLQGRGLGRELLLRALSTIVDAARLAGGKLVVVDAIDDAAVAFYERHDFLAMPSNPSRLVQKLSTVAKALGLGWP
jgi:ribosomal protein S18 acetylase RimI-like enzyme